MPKPEAEAGPNARAKKTLASGDRNKCIDLFNAMSFQW